MNIKPDDKLAYIVAPYVKSGRGHFVTIERKSREFEILNGNSFTDEPSRGSAWVCSGAVPDENGVIQTLLVIGDVCLRPIRDSEGDESFVTEARKSLPAPLQHTKPKGVEA